MPHKFQLSNFIDKVSQPVFMQNGIDTNQFEFRERHSG